MITGNTGFRNPSANPLPFVFGFPNATPLDTLWKLGLRDGLDWMDVNSSVGPPGHAFGATVNITGVDDCTAVLQDYPGIVKTKHYVEIVFKVDAGFTPPNNPESEIRVATTVSAHSIAGYEIDCPKTSAVQMVLWNGPSNNFRTTGFTLVSGTNPGPFADGDRFRVQFDGTGAKPLFNFIVNGSQVAQWRDDGASPVFSGSGGMGFDSTAGTLADMEKYCIKYFEAGNW